MIIVDINFFKNQNLLNGRSSCVESLDWILSYYDSDSIDLNTMYANIHDSSNAISDDWKRDVDLYKQSLKALEYVCNYNNVEYKETGKYRLRFIEIYEFDSLEEAKAKQEELITNRLDNLKTNLQYSIIDGNKITKITKEDLDALEEETSIKITNHLNQEKIASTKSDISNVISEFVEAEQARLLKRVRVQKNITDPTNLFDVWVNV